MKKMDWGKQHLVCRIDDNLELYADRNQYILRENGNQNNNSYFVDLEDVCHELLNYKIKENAFLNKRKTVEGLVEAVREAHKWVKRVLKPFLSSSHNADQGMRERDREKKTGE